MQTGYRRAERRRNGRPSRRPDAIRGDWKIGGPCRRGHILHPRAGKAGDEPGAAREGEIVPGPVEDDREAVAEADEKIDICEAPDEPGEKARDAHSSHLHDRVRAANRRQRAVVAIDEGRAAFPL